MIERSRRELRQKASMVRKGLGLVWRSARGWTLAWTILLVAQGAIPALQIQLTRTVVNRLSGVFMEGGWRHPAIWMPIGLIAVLWIAGQLLSSLSGWVRLAQAERVQDHVYSLIHRQALNLDLAFFENPESYDLLHRARVDAISQPLALLESLGSLVQNGLTLILVAILLAAYTPWLPVLLIASALPGLWIVGKHVLREHRWRAANTSQVRRASYFDWMLTDRGSAAEMRLFDLGPHHRESFQKIRQRLREGRMNLALAELKAELAAGLLSFSGGFLGMGWMLLRLWKGLARLGDLVLCYQAFQQGQRLLRTLMESAGQIYRSTLFLENLFHFLALRSSLPERSDPLPVPDSRGHEIRFEQLAFTYPGSERRALSDFSLTLPARTVTAIVGHNGAGKSTLVKLLCRFYDPQQGTIRMDGIDLKHLALADLRRQITVLFQEPVHYHTTAAENIAMGDLASAPDLARIRTASASAGADGPIERLEHGYDTVLGRWFGGAELSVGEWQRVALARAFLRDAALLVLDEPTSAMDSWAEIEWLRRFRVLTEGHTTLMITHRFTTAMHADRIHVMDCGRIIESGSHEELLAAGGHYAQSWKAQMREISHA
ncbi:MAG: ABC transporter ATP-binding protein [Opitutaceae bacterium]|nr:ABC transporter ATP-binding protein [Opitutaceae bacterium]